MGGFRGYLALVLGFGLLMSMGCQDKMVRKSDLNALKEHNAKLMQQNEELRGEVEALSRQPAQPTPVTPTATVATVPPPARATNDIDTIRSQLPPGATLEMRSGQPVIRIEGGMVNYGSGRAGVSAQGKRVLDRVARILNTDLAGRMVQVEGHTDSDPIRKTKHLYKNNWELGMKRASGVVEYLVSRGVDPRRIHATSFGANQPISTDKSKNRRVEIVVLPEASSYSIMGPASMSGTMR